MTPRGSAIAGLAEDVGKALLLFAERLRAEEETTAVEPSPSAGPATSRVGGTQLALLEVLRAAGPAGLTTKDAAERVGMQPTNAPRALKTLRERGLVSGGEGHPAVWRAVPEVPQP
ncbi:helix-turn-helix domain-containing protein [Nocardioides kribbensis]|uniref:helix-turn-helix domain-containing protein n=1 Tax=Nocardioides kribbensis TaxID=305517 RepID=UPI003D819B55